MAAASTALGTRWQDIVGARGKPSAHQEPEAAMSTATDPTLLIETEALNRLRSRPYRALERVSCEYREGTLTLRGRVPSYYLKQLAQAALAGLVGVRVANHLEVEPARREADA
jgi:hypothetical protein